ncbi:unnamed protein product [Thelazia callipaeda]|uniref:Uncharacterized protein n=1 Tax=Thelazia callipaeda TaxID=103827 RepID=A0A0N5CRD7_THECL|nr:unnamed protein product [Thelazia callipaeda]
MIFSHRQETLLRNLKRFWNLTRFSKSPSILVALLAILNEVNKKKSVCERKNSTVSLLSPSPCKEFQTSKSFLESALNVCKPQQKQANLRNQYSTKDSTNSLYSRSKPTYTHSDDHCCAQKHFDETMAMLYRELQLLMKNTDNHNENIESNMQMDRRSDTSVPKSDSYTNKCKAFNNLLEHKKRSRSLNKFDGEILEEKLTEGEKLNKISFPFVDESPQNSIKRHTGVNTEVIAVNSDSQNCEVSYSCATESEDNDEAVNVISWSESPHFGENNNSRFHSSTLHHNIHHRRRSSQVAEQVWRLRHRQEQERKNGVDKNLSLSTSAKMDEFVTTKISRVSNPSTVPLDHVHKQCAQLDESLDPKLGVVKEMIKQLEKPLSLITASHAI